MVRPISRPVAAAALSFLIFGCGRGESNTGGADPAQGPGGARAEPVRTHVVTFLGTSLTDGYGLDRESAFPALVKQKIDSAGLPWEVVNAGRSGESSNGALERIRWVLREPVDVLVVETGANDMLRGSEPDTLRANLDALIDSVQALRPRTRIVLVGMLALPNLGEEYGERFRVVYPQVAEEHGLTLIPFLLDEVAGVPELNQPDGIHPNEEGHRRVAGKVWEAIAPVLREVQSAAR